MEKKQEKGNLLGAMAPSMMENFSWINSKDMVFIPGETKENT